MKLNLVNVLNEIAAEEASAEILKYFDDPNAVVVWWVGDCIRKETNPVYLKWKDSVAGLGDYICDYENEMSWKNSLNEQTFDMCDWLIARGESIEHVTFEKIPTFDEYMTERLNELSNYLVAA